ncbi:hypothetical protein WJ438_20230 [Streptomyces sp. GD-15H]|uniref:hypothetical protein n=1 Tax=Streptomyces sp. GD-15H TaxID=3129112 RepID=UPI0032470CFD
MVEDLPWEEFAGDPDKYIAKLEEKEEGLQKDMYKACQELRLARRLKKHKGAADEWRRSGIRAQRNSAAEDDEDDDAAAAEGRPARIASERSRVRIPCDSGRKAPWQKPWANPPRRRASA